MRIWPFGNFMQEVKQVDFFLILELSLNGLEQLESIIHMMSFFLLFSATLASAIINSTTFHNREPF